MLSPREVAAARYTRLAGMASRVIGFGPEENDALRVTRVELLRAALRSLRSAQGTPRVVVSEWTDPQLEAAAVAVERQLDVEIAQLDAQHAVSPAMATKAGKGSR